MVGIEAKKNNLDYLIVDKGMLVNSIYNYRFFCHFIRYQNSSNKVSLN